MLYGFTDILRNEISRAMKVGATAQLINFSVYKHIKLSNV